MATSIPLESSTHYDSNSMLKIRKFNFQKIPHYKHKPIKTIATNNYVVVVGRSDLSILIFSNIDGNIDYIKTIESIPSKGPDDSMESLFLDVSGQHIIITTRSGDSFYINVSSSRQLRLSKIQGFVSSVSFGREVEDDSNNRSFLIGTTVGTIYELQLDQQGQERGCTLVMTLSEPLPITSLFFDYLGASNTSERVVLSSQDPRRVFVMFVTLTPTRLYHSCTLNFTNFKALFELPSLGFTELPGSVSHAQLHCYGTRSKSSNCQNFAMLIESGIYHGTMNFPSKR